MLEELYEEDLIGDPQTLEEEQEREVGAALFFENETDENGPPNDGNEENVESQALPQSNNVVQPKQKKVVKNPQPKLDAERLKGARGIAILEKVFADYKFCGKGHEREDLDQIMKRLEHWAHRLFPKYQFDDCLHKIETLGHKKPVMTYIKKIRMGLETADSAAVDLNDLGMDEEENETDLAVPVDPFDDLITQQISEVHAAANRSTPQNTYNPSSPLRPPKITLTAEQRERMERNRQIAQERRLARIRALQSQTNSSSAVLPSEEGSFNQDKTNPSKDDKISGEVLEIKQSVSEETNVSVLASSVLPNTSLGRKENESMSSNENMDDYSHSQKVNYAGGKSVPSEQPFLAHNSPDSIQSNGEDLPVNKSVNLESQKKINDVKVCTFPYIHLSPNQIPLNKGDGITELENITALVHREEKITEIEAIDH